MSRETGVCYEFIVYEFFGKLYCGIYDPAKVFIPK